MSAPTTTRLGLRAAPWLLWFGVLGGSVAWSMHMLVDWGIDETVCRSGHDAIGAVPLSALLQGLVPLFLVVSLLSTAVAFRLWRRLKDAVTEDDVEALRLRLAGFMALVGFAANVTFVLILAATAVAVFILPACPGSP